MSLLRKIVLSLLSFLILFTSQISYFAPQALAQEEYTWYNQTFTDWYSKVYDQDVSAPTEIFGERYTAAQVQWIIWALISQPLNWLGKDNQQFISCVIDWAGDTGVDLKKCWDPFKTAFEKVYTLLVPWTTEKEGYNNLNNYQVVASNFVGTKYIANRLSKFSIIPQANAQQEGFGYGALGIIQPLWSVSRNIAYAFLVFFMIIFAFMIMFRIKINPQTVITVQSAIPKIIVAAVLATFSFAIAGLMIDLMYVLIGVVAGFLNPMPWSISFKILYNFLTGTSAIGGATLTAPITILIYMLVYTILFLVLLIINLVSIVSTLSLFSGLLSILMLLLVVWLLILCIWYMIKIPWVLIKTVINIYLSVIVGPIQIVAGSLAPKIGFGAWLRNLVANVFVFPVVGIGFYLAYLFLAYAYFAVAETFIERQIGVEVARALGFNITGLAPGNLWSPPFLGSGAEITPLIFALMSFGIIVAIPKAADIVRAIVAGGEFSFGSAIGEATGPLKLGGTAYSTWAAGQIGAGNIPRGMGWFVNLHGGNNTAGRARAANTLDNLTKVLGSLK